MRMSSKRSLRTWRPWAQATEALPYFRKAYEELSKDAWFVENEPERLAHLLKDRSVG